MPVLGVDGDTPDQLIPPSEDQVDNRRDGDGGRGHSDLHQPPRDAEAPEQRHGADADGESCSGCGHVAEAELFHRSLFAAASVVPINTRVVRLVQPLEKGRRHERGLGADQTQADEDVGRRKCGEAESGRDLLPSLWMNRRCTQFAGMPKLGISGARRLARSVRLEQLLLLAELLAGDYQGCDVTQCVQEMERSTSVAVQIETGG
mmetsp:Transcript_27368/g.88391  ORF Transcript_27368/g.88391 Transcript_27368/m.88391 type:complete len:205 (+) Transcript_27368:570-1184(+)